LSQLKVWKEHYQLNGSLREYVDFFLFIKNKNPTLCVILCPHYVSLITRKLCVEVKTKISTAKEFSM
jgi:hypothetical protein